MAQPGDTQHGEADPIKLARDALNRWQNTGCPDCRGDCGSANPPVNCCIMIETRDALAALDAIPQPAPVPCPCTMFEQDESCPIGYPSMICGICEGTGNTTQDKVTALATEMLRIASDLGEPEDPFAAWETLQGRAAPVPADAELDALDTLADRIQEANETPIVIAVGAASAIRQALALRTRLAEVEGALQAFADFDALPVAAKRPDVFELQVRQPIMAAHRKLKEGK